MPSKASSLTAVELFCGPGGFATGLDWAGVDVLFANDLDGHTSNTYTTNHPDTPIVTEDIRDLTVDDIRTEVEAVFGDGALDDLDLIVGGPPCEGFSIAGQRDSNDPRNDLFKHYLRVVEGFRPKALVMENVRGLLSMDDGEVVDEILNQMADLGYSIDAPWELNAADYGVPQTRNRVFFVATRNNVRERPVEPPEPTHTADYNAELPRHVTVRDAICDLPTLKTGGTVTKYDRPPITDYQVRLRSEVSDELTHHECANHYKNTVIRFALVYPGENPLELPDKFDEFVPNGSYEARHRKPHPEEPAFTVTSHCIDEMVHYTQPRILSVREMARFQSFPDKYRFKGPRSNGHHSPEESQYEQVGNAVPPILAECIARHLRNEVLG